MRGKKAKEIRKHVLETMYKEGVTLDSVRDDPQFKKIVRRRKKNYTRGTLQS